MLVAQYYDDEAWDALAEGPESGLPLSTFHTLAETGSLEWDDNYDAVLLFAAFCTEGANQMMEVSEAYTPYAIFRTAPSGEIEIQDVSWKQQPWLDGVRDEDW